MELDRTKARKKKTSASESEKLRDLIIECLEDGKAEDIVEIDLEGKADFAHFMIIASGRSSRHISSLADDVEKTSKQFGLHDTHSEGAERGEWVLVDAIDVVVHLFKPETRTTYDLEKMWGFEVKH